MGTARICGSVLVACLALAWCGDAGAMRRIDPGELVTLDADEGLLVIAVDTSGHLDSVNLRRNGSLFGRGRLGKVPAGHTLQLFVAKEGSYRWDAVRWFGGLRFDLEHDDRYDFEVRPGRINYPGDLVFRTRGFLRAILPVVNRGLRVLDWLNASHPQLAREYRFSFTGHYPDAFPAMLHAHERGREPPSSLPAPTAPEPRAAEGLPLPVELLWRAPRIRQLAQDERGTVLAELAVSDEGRWVVDLFDLEHSRVVRVLDSEMEITELHWAGPRTLLAVMGSTYLMQKVFVLELWDDSAGADARLEVKRFEIQRAGSIVDALYKDPGRILFAVASRGIVSVHEMDISSEEAANSTRFRRSQRLNKGVDSDRAWFTDASGKLRLALAAPDDEWVMVHGQDGEYTRVLDGDMLSLFEPMELSADGWTLYGISEHERDQRELVAVDLRDPGRMTTVFAKPGVDVLRPVFSHDGELVGASFMQAGQVVAEYFGEADAALVERLQSSFPGKSVYVASRDAGRRHFVLSVDAADSPWRLYHYDAVEQRASLLDHAMPWLKGKRLFGNSLVQVASKDGTPIDAFLTLPQDPVLAPLVVMPHGGPVGVADSRHFDPDVQFLASIGYAVLQVNFRGSDGYGKAFREAAIGQYGAGLEDDIQAAVDAALAAHPIDGSRICAMGSSYGGYSAMMLAIRWPDRYRCVVARSAPTDLALTLTSSDYSADEALRERKRELMVGPDGDVEALRARSPLYRYRELRAPLLLVHGVEDRRVDYEHTRRLQRMLALDGRPPEVIAMEREGHGIVAMETLDEVTRYAAGFLDRHLARVPAVPTAAR